MNQINAQNINENASAKFTQSYSQSSLNHVPQCGMNSSKPRRTSLGKRALFFTSVPFYWGLFFHVLLGWFNPFVFGAVVIGSFAASMMGSGWGLLDNLAH